MTWSGSHLLTAGFFVDWIGRRWAIILNSTIFITGAIILTVAPVYEVLVGKVHLTKTEVASKYWWTGTSISSIVLPKHQTTLTHLKNELALK